ncbi:Rieske (2Fe-2S) protein [Fibrisoma montanum]|uniref:Rieske (2Fe-2S) protein n=1 Tax=Fibrisoma montanum TaxID=2305895 RepID=A0A418LXP9_9BACT|nr:Rieske (2Fe-2S) protein [Fibrisoma montanum]RIV17998.1 Rieske (2Fe-2S) protein [Fibrisoma montanum]
MQNTPSATIDRHTFIRLVGSSVGAVLLAPCALACNSGGDTEPVAPEAIDFTFNWNEPNTDYANLKLKGGYVVVRNILVAQTKAGEFLAVSAKCTHQNTQLTYRSTEGQFYCPLHASRFDQTGKVINGPATTPLVVFRVTVDANAGTVRVTSA